MARGTVGSSGIPTAAQVRASQEGYVARLRQQVEARLAEHGYKKGKEPDWHRPGIDPLLAEERYLKGIDGMLTSRLTALEQARGREAMAAENGGPAVCQSCGSARTVKGPNHPEVLANLDHIDNLLAQAGWKRTRRVA